MKEKEKGRKERKGKERKRKGKERKGKEGGHLVPATGLGCQPLLERTYTSVQDDPWAVEHRGIGSPADRNVLQDPFKCS